MASRPPTNGFSLSTLFAKPLSESPLQKDLPRLASRISIQSKTASLTAGSDLATVVRTLASVLLQNDEVALSNVESALRVFTEATSKSSLAQGHKAMDQQEACSELLESLGGDGSRLVRALKLVNQNVVLFALTSLRDKWPNMPLTKDVRTPDGWQISIEVFDSLRICHTRREKSMDMMPPTANTESDGKSGGIAKDSFEFRYSTSATIDLPNVQRVHASWLRIEEASFSPTMTPALKAKLQRVLGNGGPCIVDGSSENRGQEAQEEIF